MKVAWEGQQVETRALLCGAVDPGATTQDAEWMRNHHHLLARTPWAGVKPGQLLVVDSSNRVQWTSLRLIMRQRGLVPFAIPVERAVEQGLPLLIAAAGIGACMASIPAPGPKATMRETATFLGAAAEAAGKMAAAEELAAAAKGMTDE